MRIMDNWAVNLFEQLPDFVVIEAWAQTQIDRFDLERNFRLSLAGGKMGAYRFVHRLFERFPRPLHLLLDQLRGAFIQRDRRPHILMISQ